MSKRRIKRKLQKVARGYIRDAVSDCNPFPLGNGIHACGPTTGEWLSANDLEVVGYFAVKGITFTLATFSNEEDQ